MNFYVGQKVVCVDDAARPTAGLGWSFKKPNVHIGEVYTIGGFENGGGELGVYLLEVVSNYPPFPRSGLSRSFYPDRFRPVVERKTDISIFTAMLNPSHQKVTA